MATGNNPDQLDSIMLPEVSREAGPLEDLTCDFLCEGSAADVYLCSNSKASSSGTQDVRIVKKVMRVVPNYLKSIAVDLGEDLLTGLRNTFGDRFMLWESLRHPNIARLHFVAPNELTLYQEYYPNHDLREYAKNSVSDHNYMSIIEGVLAGLVYLHSQNPPIAHGSINPGKIFITDGKPKLGEFGLARLTMGFPHLAPSISLDEIVRWMSPEYFISKPKPECEPDSESDSESELELDASNPTTQLDMWSFGCTLFEVITGQLPYHQCKYDAQVIQRIINGDPPGYPKRTHTVGDTKAKTGLGDTQSEIIWKLIEKCWLPVERRPSSGELLEEVESSRSSCGEANIYGPTSSAAALSPRRRGTMPPTFSGPYYPAYPYHHQQGFYDDQESRKRPVSFAPEQDDDEEAPSISISAAPTPRDENKSKRTKTQRGCDPCRRKKIRCDILPDTDPPICRHCKQYSFNCTFFLPITETRFKKKRMEEQEAKPQTTPPTPSIDVSAHQLLPPQPQPQSEGEGEVKIYGPTSPSLLVHSTATIPVHTTENYNTRYHQTWQAGASGERFIQGLEPTSSQQASAPLPKHLEHRLERETLQNLINAYFRDVAPTFCVITREEFVRSPTPTPVLLYSMCIVAACSRRVERGVFEALRGALSTVMRNEDVLSVSSVANVQALLILSMNGDYHSVSVHDATSAAWLRATAAIRMAQDLGMYRAETAQDNLELRRRLWIACVIVDSWYAASFGRPLNINLLDCDVRLPRSDEAEGMKMEFMGELVKLSILLGRVLKSIYSPTGLLHVRDSILETLLADLDIWKHQLPPAFAFNSPASASAHAGLLHLFYTCVCMMFWHVFMRISYSCPAHLKFSLTVERMTELVRMSQDTIDWLVLEANEQIVDSCYMVGYAATAAALIQYHAWARRKDPEAVVRLRKLKDMIQRWEALVELGHMLVRRKTAEIICLLYEATQSVPEPSQTTDKRLNPTVGVHNVRAPEALRGLEFRKDASRPGGGVFIASKRMIPALSDLPRGTVVPWPDTPEGDRDRESVSGTSVSGTSGSAESMFGCQTPTGTHVNVNPALALVELDPGDSRCVQVLNMLDQPMPGEFMVDANGMLSGIGMSNVLSYDLGGVNEQLDSLFSRFQPPMAGGPGFHMMPGFGEPYMATGHPHPSADGIGFPPMQPYPQ